jgi:hypothetical protein
MKFSSKLGVVCGLLLVATFAASRADDFSWEKPTGMPTQVEEAACEASPACVGFECVDLDPPVTVVPNGGSSSVVVKSYKRLTTSTYGTCKDGYYFATCSYYSEGVECADLSIFGQPGCKLMDLWGAKTVYSGNCNGK